ncbi:tectonin beta-propeller repeat-containing protein 1 [Puma concolor]|uniref:Tectonin beta-propeller repeat-containing protein 1 n=1 Tax=Puma concolor TaxID=9696 RepID=A0A6P6HT38_PUMCO|nr:tectonin beta-propeller repeat-containing protein 1 [Puma concolor]
MAASPGSLCPTAVGKVTEISQFRDVRPGLGSYVALNERRALGPRQTFLEGSCFEIPSKDDPEQLPDPFNDLSVGGWEITDEPVGRLSVWAVSLQGKVWYREDVSHPNPEGSSWSLMDTPGEAVQISCGPHDLLWVTLWEGQALVREGINRNNPKGSSWSIVEPPTSENGIMHVSVGVSVVWAITKDRKVWFRRGINSHNPCGTSWIEMVGEMTMVNVGLNDQVWGIGCEDRAIYFRQGVTQSELSGKTWKAIVASRECDRSHSGSSSSLLSAGCFFGDEVRGSGESCAPSDTDASSEAERPGPDRPGPAESGDSPGKPRDSLAPGSGTGRTTEPNEEEVAGPAIQTPGLEPCPGPASTLAELPWTNIDLKEPRRAPSRSAAGFPETTGLSSLGLLPLGLEEPYGADDHPLWAWVSGGDCAVEAHTVLKWFTVQSGLSPSMQTLSLSITPAQTAAWRKQIFQQLTERTKRELENFRHYEQAVEQSVWVKTGALQWWCDWKPHKWVDVRVALEQFTGLDGARDSILFIYYVVHEEKKLVAMVKVTRQPAASGESTPGQWLRCGVGKPDRRGGDGPGRPGELATLTLEAAAAARVDPGRVVVADAPHHTLAVGFHHPSYHGYKTMKDFVRRRCWARKCKLVTSGPWLEVGPLALADVSIIPESPSTNRSGHSIALWAISDKGDVLCRLGVSELNPAGSSWLHVGTDQPFTSVSIGACHQVWAVARDGSAFYRGSVSPAQPAGDCWYHIPSPPKQRLKQVSVGQTSVYALDENGNLWYRQGVTPSYPQGSSWEHVSNNVRQVSVGPLDQVWVIANKVQGSHSLSRGTVCHRTGVQPREPKGQGWDYGIGGGWDHISVRANATRALRGRSQERAAECSGERGLPGAPSGVAGVPQEAPGLVRC